MARTTGKSGFKMKSGNTTPFKQMGSSPVKQNIFKDPDHKAKKYRTGEYRASGEKSELAYKPGESKFQYDIRMRKGGRKAPSTKPGSTYQAPDPSAEISTGGPSYDFQMQERNPGDLRMQGRSSTSRLPSAPGDLFEYDFDEEGNIAYIDRSKGEDAKWQFPERGSTDDKAIRERYTGSETGDLSSWYEHDTYGETYSYTKDPEKGENWMKEGTDFHDWNEFEKKSYLPYDLAQKYYNPKYKGSKK